MGSMMKDMENIWPEGIKNKTEGGRLPYPDERGKTAQCNRDL